MAWCPSVRNGGFPSFQDILSQEMEGLQMIGVLIFPNFQLLDAAGPISTFEIAMRYSGNGDAVRAIAINPGPVRSSSGVEMLARGAKASAAITTLIVAGGE